MKLLKYIGIIIVLMFWLIVSLIAGIFVGIALGFVAWNSGIQKYNEIVKLKEANHV